MNNPCENHLWEADLRIIDQQKLNDLRIWIMERRRQALLYRSLTLLGTAALFTVLILGAYFNTDIELKDSSSLIEAVIGAVLGLAAIAVPRLPKLSKDQVDQIIGDKILAATMRKIQACIDDVYRAIIPYVSLESALALLILAALKTFS
ncbi:MAG: hypothetical protein H6671_17600 [Anaerolineaceae bacterium]|nr:hypothetical protein [Anaerolineaceae bacterium]